MTRALAVAAVVMILAGTGLFAYGVSGYSSWRGQDYGLGTARSEYGESDRRGMSLGAVLIVGGVMLKAKAGK